MFNITKFANGTVPDSIYNHGKWFLYLSNDIEKERIKMETRKIADKQNRKAWKIRNLKG